MAKARTFASLGVSITAKTSGFSRGMKRARRSLKAFGKSVVRVAANVIKFSAALTAAAGAALAVFIKRSFTALDALAKTTDKLGIAIDQYKGLQRAIELTGGSVQALEKGLITLTINTDDAARGIGEAKEAFEDLGIDARTLLRLSPDKMLARISDALQKIPSQTKRIAIVGGLFGTRGAKELLNLLNLGSKRIAAMVTESKRLSGSFSRLDLSLIERANDAFADMLRTIRAIGDKIAIAVAPLVELLSRRLADSFVNFRLTLVQDVLPRIRNFIQKALNAFDIFIRTIRVGFTEMIRDTIGVLIELQQALHDTFPDKVGLPDATVKAFLALDRSAFLQQNDLANLRAVGQTAGGIKLLGDRIGDAIAKVQKVALKELVVSGLRRAAAPFAFLASPLESFKDILRRLAEQIPTTAARSKALANKLATSGGVPFRAGTPSTDFNIGRSFLPALGTASKPMIVRDPQATRQRQAMIRAIESGALAGVAIVGA